RRLARELDDQRNPDLLLEEGPAVPLASVFVELLSVIRGVDDRCGFPPPPTLERGGEPAELVVSLADRPVVVEEHLSARRRRRCALLLGEETPVACREYIRKVRIDDMNVQEESRRTLPVEELESRIHDLPRARPPDFVVAGDRLEDVEPPLETEPVVEDVSIPDESRRPPAGLAAERRESDGGRVEAAVPVDRHRFAREERGQERRHRGTRPRRDREGVLEYDRLPGQRRGRRARVAPRPVNRHPVRPERIHQVDDDRS